MSVNKDSEDAPLIDGNDQEPKKGWTTQGIIKLVAVVVVIIALVVLIIVFHKDINKFTENGGILQTFVKKIGVWGYIVYALVYAACTVLFIPGSALTIGAGFVFHTPQYYSVFLAFAVVSVGSVTGAALAFLLGGSVFREWVQEQIKPYPVFAAVEGAIANEGAKIVFLLRLSPVIPFNLLNYALGVTTVPFYKYFFASWIGMVPGTFLYVYIGWIAAEAATAGSGKGKGDTKTDIIKDVLIYGVGSVATIGVVVLVTMVARRAINKAIAEMEAQQAKQDEEAARPVGKDVKIIS